MEFVSKSMPWEEIKILPIGDIQWFGRESEVAIGMLARAIEWGVENKCWFIGMGDYIDAFSPSNRAEIKSAKVYDSARTVFDDKAEDLVMQLFERALKPSVGRWLGLLEGHHFHEYQNGTTTDQQLCKLLKAPFLGTLGYIRLKFQDKSKRRGTVLIWCHHGAGSGQSEGYVLNKLGRLAGYWREADIFIMGHTHQKVGKPLDSIRAIWPVRGARTLPKLVHRTVIIAGTGGFLRGYIEGRTQGDIPRGTYIEKAMLAPVALGSPLLKITPRFKRHVVGENNSVWLPDLGVEL